MDSVSVMVIVLFEGDTVAVMAAVLPAGTTGVPEKVTVGVTVPGAEPVGVVR